MTSLNIGVFDILDPANKEWLDVFEDYRDHIVKTYDDKYIENYGRKRFRLEDHLGVFLTVDQDTREVIRFETVFQLSSWPKTVARLFTRAWVDPSFRAKGISSARKRLAPGSQQVNTMYSYPKQIEIAQRAGVTCAIISRAMGQASSAKIESVTHLINRFYPGWEVSKGKFYLTCHQEKERSCWQRIAALELAPGGRKALEDMRRITDAEFEGMFGLQNA